MLKVSLYGDSDIGRVRRINEDSFELIPAKQAMVVCDGMGGHAAGEVASKRAVQTFRTYLMHDPRTMRTSLATLPYPKLSAEALDMVQAVRLANRSVFMTAQEKRGMRGMGTTLVAARFTSEQALICHVGDSRAYHFSKGKLRGLTTDHSLLAELKAQGELTPEQERNFPERNVITRALGTRPSVSVDVAAVPVVVGDWIMLCSDGLCGYVEDIDIERTLMGCYPDPEKAIRYLIEAANSAGGHDNVTIAIAVIDQVDIEDDQAALSATIPEATPSEEELEIAYIDEMLQEDHPIDDDEDTDRIRIVRPGQDRLAPPDPAEDPERTDGRRRTLWPW